MTRPPAPIRYHLTPEFVMWGLQLGMNRVLNAECNDLQPQGPSAQRTADPIARHMNGGLAEVVLALHLDKPLPPPESVAYYRHHIADLPPRDECRWAARPELVIRPKTDTPCRIYWLITGNLRAGWEVRGWFTREECRDEHLRDPHGWGLAWFIPIHELHLPTEPPE